ncbi:hypothetical protein C6W88_15775 [Halomonas litopenaei]|uniref:DUF1351 domain-containing protein n=1 Tax=Halomonas litopenaei TaxID=2109328 RepID=A0ABX5IY80_9GAMM|nr:MULTISPECIES: hypothetical protein [Halomonas]PTL88583.1 hypothetical protein C6W89_20960 [Halomonas sp. SYSU XM8]PTL93470.1 hypothetical protein C6W88_15775 [Halomonas litopenaei]
MTAVAEKESTELVTVPSKETALEVFKTDKGLDPYLATIREELDAFLAEPPTLDTAKGRQAYASMAHKIARSKTAIDNIGKELVADLKQLPKTIDAERKRWRDQLDAWRDEARGPLNEWEAAEEARKAQHQAGIERLDLLASDIPNLDSKELANCIAEAEAMAIGEHWEEYEAEAARTKDRVLSLLREGLAKRQAYEAEQAELARLRAEAEAREQKEREERIAREAEERARREAEAAAQAERDAAARREAEAKAAAERREREHKEAIERQRREAEAERQRIEDEHRRREEERLADERRQQDELARRQADKEHRARINRAALEAMIGGGMPEDCAKTAITLIAKGQIPSITISY